MRTRLLILGLVAGLYALHQDVWFWRAARPLVLGFLPIGLAYHALFCLAAAALLWVLTRVAWPAHLADPTSRDGGGQGLASATVPGRDDGAARGTYRGESPFEAPSSDQRR